MPPLAAVETVPIVAALIVAVLVFSAWVYAMIRIDPVADTLGQDGPGQPPSEAWGAGERAWLRVPPVRPGGVCQVPGSVGSTSTGVAMICTPERDGISRWRWRQLARRSA